MAEETVVKSPEVQGVAVLGRRLRFRRETVREFDRVRQADVPMAETCSTDVSNRCCGPSCFTACCPP